MGLIWNIALIFMRRHRSTSSSLPRLDSIERLKTSTAYRFQFGWIGLTLRLPIYLCMKIICDPIGEPRPEAQRSRNNSIGHHRVGHYTALLHCLNSHFMAYSVCYSVYCSGSHFFFVTLLLKSRQTALKVG